MAVVISGGGDGMARRVRWTGASIEVTATNVIKVIDTLIPDGHELTQRGMTLLRVRGEIAAYSLVNANTALRGAMGMIIGQEGLQTPDLPDPSMHPDADWFYYQSIARPAPPTRGIVDGNAVSHHWVVDTKSKRKMKDHQQIYFAADSLISAGVIRYAVSVRILYALP